MTKKFLFIFIIFAGVLILTPAVSATNPFAEIEYPVEELGNCQDRAECKEFCDVPENLNVCLDFARGAGLISEQEAEMARKLEGKIGPGGCEGMDECELYCEDIDNIDECLDFAEEHDIVNEEELEEMRKISIALKQGIRPPCNSKRECDEICHLPEHAQKCMEFATAAGLMDHEESEESKKYLQAIANGAIPPACNGPRECDIYCSQKENMLECSEFALAAGFTTPGEEEGMRRSIEVMKQGIMPPNCRGREECDVYCSEEEHVEECMLFSVAAGYMTQRQADNFRKTGGKGPGGCVGESQCYEFCGNPDNVEVCLGFGVSMGEMTQEEADRKRQEMKEGRGSSGSGGCRTPEECESFCQNEENAIECIWMQVGKGEITEQEAREKEQALRAERGEYEIYDDKNMSPDMGRTSAPNGEGDWKPMDIEKEKEYLKQKMQEEYGDEWEEKFNEKIESGFFDHVPTQGPMNPDENRGQYPEGDWQEGDKPQGDYQKDFEGDFRDDDGQFQRDTRYIPREGEGEFQPKSDFSPDGINNIIYDAERSIREGVINEISPDNAYPEESYRESVPAYDSDYQDSIYKEPTHTEPISESNPQPMPAPGGYNEPISESNPQPMPAPTSFIKDFVGSVLKFLWGE